MSFLKRGEGGEGWKWQDGREEKKFKNRWGDPGASCRLGRGGKDEATTLRPKPHGCEEEMGIPELPVGSGSSLGGRH